MPEQRQQPKIDIERFECCKPLARRPRWIADLHRRCDQPEAGCERVDAIDSPAPTPDSIHIAADLRYHGRVHGPREPPATASRDSSRTSRQIRRTQSARSRRRSRSWPERIERRFVMPFFCAPAAIRFESSGASSAKRTDPHATIQFRFERCIKRRLLYAGLGSEGSWMFGKCHGKFGETRLCAHAVQMYRARRQQLLQHELRECIARGGTRGRLSVRPRGMRTTRFSAAILGDLTYLRPRRVLRFIAISHATRADGPIARAGNNARARSDSRP